MYLWEMDIKSHAVVQVPNNGVALRRRYGYLCRTSLAKEE
jgi:hypothetical protein